MVEVAWSKIMKGAIVVACLSACCYQIYDLLDKFFYGDKWTTSTVIKYSSSMEFPNISICSFNRINRTRADEIGLSENKLLSYVHKLNLQAELNAIRQATDNALSLQEYFFAMLLEQVSTNHVINFETIVTMRNSPTLANFNLARVLYNEYKKESNDTVTIRSLMISLGHTCIATVSHCTTDGIQTACCNHSKAFLSQYGSCFTINFMTFDGEMYKQQLPGEGNGIAFYLSNSDDIQLKNPINNNQDTGFMVSTSYTADTYFGYPVPVYPGQHVWIELTKRREITNDEGSLFDALCSKQGFTPVLKAPYTMQSCSDDCRAGMLFEYCNCTSAIFLSTTPPACEPDQFYKCGKPLIKQWQEGATNLLRAFNACITHCRPGCDESSILSSIMSNPFPAESQVHGLEIYFQQTMGFTFPGDYFKKNWIVVQMYFNHFSTEILVRTPKTTFIDLTSNFGGIVGLWLGSSFLTAYDIFSAMIRLVTRRSVTISAPSSSQKIAQVKK